jgi:hypothetical protein
VGFANVVIVHKYCGFPLDFQLNEELIIKKKGQMMWKCSE